MLDLNVRTVLAMANDGRLPASRLADSRKYHFLLEDAQLDGNLTDQDGPAVFGNPDDMVLKPMFGVRAATIS